MMLSYCLNPTVIVVIDGAIVFGVVLDRLWFIQKIILESSNYVTRDNFVRPSHFPF